MQIETILVIDDDPAIRRVAEITLSKVGKWRVILAASGSEALSIALNQKPDVILLDVMMPGMDGPSTFKLLKDEVALRQTPVIFMTAKVLRHEVENYRRMGISGVILKPFDPMTLCGNIKEIVSQFVTSCTPLQTC